MGNVLGTSKVLGKLFGFDKVQYQITRNIGENFNPVISAKGTGVMTSVFKNGKFAKAGKGTRAILNTIGKGLLLTRTAGFFPAMGAVALVAGGVGYLLGNIGNNTKDKDMGLVVEKEEPKVAPEEQKPVADVEVTEVDDYHTINTGGYTWKTIVENYYPGLVEKHNGKLYGSDGAIRALKDELSKCENIDLINASDIPAKLHLPLNIDGVGLNKNTNPERNKITATGGHTDIKEAGCKNTHTEYKVEDKQNNQSYMDKNLETAVDSLKSRTNVKDYELKFAS